MSFLLKNNIHSSLAKTFYSDILSQRNMYYYFLGRTLPWVNNKDLPPVIPDTFSEEAAIRHDIVYMSRIGVNDISFVTKRIDWEVDTVYDKYDPDISADLLSATGAAHLKNAKFYVLTDDMNVYKCISNNGGAASQVKPTGIDYEIVTLADGYSWKFMYSIQPALQYKFLTETHMPVTRALNNRYYDNQGIESVTINNAGSGYEGGPITTAEVIGDGIDARIALSLNPDDGSIAHVRIQSQGSGYTTGSINVISMDGLGSGRYDNPTAILVPKFKDGKLIDVIIEDPGNGYSTDMQTNIVVDGTGSGAKLFPIVENGEIVDVIIADPGKGYTTVMLTIESVTGSGAELVVSTGIGDVDNIQADIELLAVPGSVDVIDVVQQGQNYTYANCIVTGDGTGLAVTPIIYNGLIIRYQIDNPGSGYSWCNIEIQGNGTGAEARSIISPYRGHGYNAVDELFADTLSFYTSVKFNKNQPLMLNNDYRQFGIIRNPEKLGQTASFRDLTGVTCYTVTVNDASSAVADQQLVLSSDTTKKFVVVGTDNVNTLLVQNFSGVALAKNAQLLDEVSGLTYTVTAVTNPAVNKLSGDLLFVDNRTPIFQRSTQFVSLRTTIKF